MIEALGWISTFLVLIGYTLNAKGKFQYAMVAWIVGDIGWITYDFYISNFSHLVLSSVIILLNLYGIFNIKRMQNGSDKRS
jgi:hypothetical protein|tara:strand:+ start:479 stop:721 length:243 start_codon:yes stop_codon:yes gene_type:complete